MLRLSKTVFATLILLISGVALVTPAAATTGFVSDDFSSGFLGSAWSVVDPIGDGSVSFSGVGSNDVHAELSVPAGTSHDAWNDNRSLRVMQTVADDDGELEASFDSVPSQKYQIQGLLFEQDADNWIRFDVYSTATQLRVFAGVTTGGTSSSVINKKLRGSPSAIAIRVSRTGDTWSMWTSADGGSWALAGAFSQPLTLSSAGVFAGNHNPSPAFTARVDYVFDTASPIVPEDGGNPVNQYTVATQTVGSGSVSKSPDQPTYPEGSSVQLTASPAAGWVFDGWSGDASGTQNPLTVTVDGNKSITATFIESTATQYTVATQSVGSGSVSKSPDQATYDEGSSVQLTATPDAGWVFDGWSGDASGTQNPVTVTVDGNKSITATFSPSNPGGGSFQSDDFSSGVLGSPWTEVDPIGDGSVAFSGVGSNNVHAELSVPAGTSHDAWDDNNSLRIMQPVTDDDIELEAWFDSVPSQKYQLQGLLFEQDADNWIRFDVYSTASQLRAFAGVTTAGDSASRINKKLTGVSSSVAFRVSRTGDTWQMSVSTDGGSWSPMGSFSHPMTLSSAGVFAGNHNPSPAFTARVDYAFDTASPIVPEDGGGPVNQYTVATQTVGSGSVSKSPDQATYPEGSSVQLTATPDAGWVFDGWSGDASGTQNPVTVTVDGNKSITATFIESTATQYTVSTSVVGSGTVSKSPDQATYDEGSSVQLTASPNAGWTFDGWSGDASGTQNPLTITVDSNKTVTATFSPTNPGNGPIIDVWDGLNQDFGSNGVPQPWANIRGNVSDPSGVTSLTYQVNGGAAQSLSIGPDLRRLEHAGDFNIELDRNTLPAGANSVTITAINGNSQSSSVTVTANLIESSSSLPQTIDWSTVGQISDVAEIVDGPWTIEGGQVRVDGLSNLGYDRIIAIGDQSWTDFEVKVPVHLVGGFGDGWGTSTSGEPLAGLALRWQGHSQTGNTQPRRGFYPVGAYTWHRWRNALTDGRFITTGNDGAPIDRDLTWWVTTGDSFWFRARVETVPGGTQYSVKTWRTSDPEPAGWGTEILEDSGLANGSIALIAHHVDARFGTVEIQPLGGGGSSFTEQVIDATVDQTHIADGADFNGDGLTDVIATDYVAGELRWYENTGTGFISHILDGNLGGAYPASVADVDEDGNMDVLAGGYLADVAMWYEGDGAGGFTPHVIDAVANGIHSLEAVDLDGDGDQDILTTEQDDGDLVWYENDGNESFTHHYIDSHFRKTKRATAVDLDADGDMDVAAVSHVDNRLSWYENDGNEVFTERIVSSSLNDAYYVDYGDFNGDGDIDLLTASAGDHRVTWFENDGSESFTTHTIDNTLTGARTAVSADIDGDGDLDAVAAGPDADTVAWYENNGSGSFTPHIVSSNIDGAYGLNALDFDGNGSMDLLVASRDDDTVALWSQ